MRDQRRRRWSLAEKATLVRRSYEPGMSVSLVARQEGVAASLLFQWRKLERQGALTAVSAGEAVVPASELAAARAEIAKLQRVIGKKTLENETLKEAVEFLFDDGGADIAAETRQIARQPSLAPSTQLCSPQSNGMAESFVNTFKRDYVSRMDLVDVRTVMAQMAAVFEHYNEVHPHSAALQRILC